MPPLVSSVRLLESTAAWGTRFLARFSGAAFRAPLDHGSTNGILGGAVAQRSFTSSGVRP